VTSSTTFGSKAARVRAAGEPALVVEHLTKHFGSRIALDDVCFEVEQGEVFGLLGPNGAGKTTMIRILGTLIKPTFGNATVTGISLSRETGSEIRARISIMPETPGLYLRLTVWENLECFAGLYQLSHVNERIRKALASVNLADRQNELCGSLSKGLRQRVALARSLLSDPAVLFLDEPTSGLDPVAAHEVHDLIGALREHGVTTLVTTHRLEEAERLCDRVAIVNTKLLLVGKPDTLRADLFSRKLEVRLSSRLRDPSRVFSEVLGVKHWEEPEAGSYLLDVEDPDLVAPPLIRTLVGCGADVLAVGERRHSLEDVYLQLIGDGAGERK